MPVLIICSRSLDGLYDLGSHLKNHKAITVAGLPNFKLCGTCVLRGERELSNTNVNFRNSTHYKFEANSLYTFVVVSS